MEREDAPGGLDTMPDSVVEGFLIQEALRYRRALIEIEKTIPEGIDLTKYPENIWRIATEALDAGDEAAG